MCGPCCGPNSAPGNSNSMLEPPCYAGRMMQSASRIEIAIILAAVTVTAALLILVAAGVAVGRRPVRYLLTSHRRIAEGR